MTHSALERPQKLHRVMTESTWEEFLERNPAVLEMMFFIIQGGTRLLAEDEMAELRRVWGSRETLWAIADAGRAQGGVKKRGGRTAKARERMRERQEAIVDAASRSVESWDEFPAIAAEVGAVSRRPAVMNRLRRLASRSR